MWFKIKFSELKTIKKKPITKCPHKLIIQISFQIIQDTWRLKVFSYFLLFKIFLNYENLILNNIKLVIHQ